MDILKTNIPVSMTTDQDKCGLNSLLTMSCRGRAEAFARRLHTRLRTLGLAEVTADESTWLAAQCHNQHDTTSALNLTQQPRTFSSDSCLEFDQLESPGSPQDEVDLHKLLNADNLQHSLNTELQMQKISALQLDLIKPENGTSEVITNGYTNGLSNGYTNGHHSPEEEKIERPSSPTYVSSIEVSKNLTVECPDEDSEEKTPRVRRCSSLKTGKTPPGTPGRKKIVRFADVLGLDLADVRTFLDEIPKIPTSAYEDLTDVDLSDSAPPSQFNPALKFNGIKAEKLLVPLFQQPGILITFLDQVRDNLVCLESAVVDDPLMFSIKGAVRVRNLDFHKSVHIRYTMNSWKTFADVPGKYVENSCDGFSDLFTFVIYAHTLSVGQRLEFAVRFQCKGCQYWDNNKGVNYCFQCLPASNSTPYTPITCSDDWGASFYYEELNCKKDGLEEDEEAKKLTPAAVHELINKTLGVREVVQHEKKIDVFTVLTIVLLSFLFICIQKAIYLFNK